MNDFNDRMNDFIDYEVAGGPEGIDEYWEHRAWVEMNRAELAAENAWLYAAEAATAEDEAFEVWEMGRGCYVDPQSGYRI